MSGRRVKWCDKFVAENVETEPRMFAAMVQKLRYKPHVKARLLRLHSKVYEGGTA